MRNQVRYEWCVEILDAPDTGSNDPDIIDYDFCDTLAEAREVVAKYYNDVPHRIVLVRDEGNDLDGLVDRSWAYLKDGKLPDEFTYGMGELGAAVPKRFHKETSRA